jgi:hypothetical protein
MSGSQTHVSNSKPPQALLLKVLTEYSWFNALVDTAPQLGTASYRFTPSTGAVSVIDDSIVQPNGIAFGPKKSGTGARTVYISDTGAIEGTIVQSLGPRGAQFNTTGKRAVYAFDLTANGKHIINKRPIYLAQDWVPDGLKAAANGYVCEFLLSKQSSVGVRLRFEIIRLTVHHSNGSRKRCRRSGRGWNTARTRPDQFHSSELCVDRKLFPGFVDCGELRRCKSAMEFARTGSEVV